jgi:hypothetical protein
MSVINSSSNVGIGAAGLQVIKLYTAQTVTAVLGYLHRYPTQKHNYGCQQRCRSWLAVE